MRTATLEPKAPSGSGGSAPYRPCRVLGVVGEPPSGVTYVRFTQPFAHLQPLGFDLATLGRALTLCRGPHGYEPDPALLAGCSLVIFPQTVRSPVLPDGRRVEVVEPLCREARRRGLKVVYSVDDHLAQIEPSNPDHDTVRESMGNVRTILDHAHAVIATTGELRRSLDRHGKPVHVIPNAIDPAHIRPRPRSSPELRLGWAGGSSHLEDLLMVVPALQRIRTRIDFRLALLGLCDTPFDRQVEIIRCHRRGFTPAQAERAERFLELIGHLREIPHAHVPFQPMGGYFDALSALDLDLGLCPLLDAPFNRHKSAIKFYEYAACGTMTIASRVPPYEGEVSVTVPNDPAAWAEAIEQHLREPAERQRQLALQRAFVLGERNIETLSLRWAEVLRAILA